MEIPPPNAIPSCPECARLQKLVGELEAELATLKERLNAHSGNSSIPPSANPLHAPKPKAKAKSRRKRGGQPGHPGHHRKRVAPERVDHVVDHVPATCSCCQAALPAEPQAGDPQPTWHQVMELPPAVIEITEHRGHARTCPECGEVTRAAIPPAVAASVIGPRLGGLLSSQVAQRQITRRGCQELVALLGGEVSLGTISRLESEVADALAGPHAEAVEHVRTAAAKNGDETSWKQAGKRCWLWTVATSAVACFVIHARRGLAGLQTILGEISLGTMTSDRWSAYSAWPLEKRQICWSHLIRDFQKCVDRGGPSEPFGQACLAVAHDLFQTWREFHARTIGRDELRRRLTPLRERLRSELERGRASPHSKSATFATNLLNLEPALWLFVEHDGVEPTNNHAERMLRRGVLWRKISFGSASDRGTRFAERMLTVVQTLRLQDRPVLDYLSEAIRAHRNGDPAPSLLP